MNKKVLLIAHHFYPSNASGAHRPAKLAKYLPHFGWTPVVLCAEWTPENSGNMYDPLLTAQPDVCRTVRVPYPAKPSSKVGRAIYWTSPVLFPYRAPFGFTRRMLAAAEDLVRQEHFDVIWSTYMPGLTHYVASRIARRYGIPWVADFRDIPDQDFGPWRLRHTVRQEVRACRWASALTATTTRQTERLASRYDKPAYAVFNGFDPDDFPPGRKVDPDKFTIRYFGGLSEHRNPRPLFLALDRLAEVGEVDLNEVRVEFYGASPGVVSASATGCRCCTSLVCHGRIAHAEVIELQQRSAGLLLLKLPEAGESIPAKVFEYMGSARPILNVPGDGDIVDALLHETGAGISAESPKEIAKALRRWYEEWKATGTVVYRGIPEKIARYTRREQAGQLARIFDSMTPGRSGGGMGSHSRGRKEAASNAG
jgi:glycosyltransferase involved in cell wall biosynthesis